MAPGSNERYSGRTGTIPKARTRNNPNLPQEVVTPTRRDMTNLGSNSLDWVPVSEFNIRFNDNQSRKSTNNTSDQESVVDFDNSVTYESGFGRFVPVRPQPRVSPFNLHNHNALNDQIERNETISSRENFHAHANQVQNGFVQHNNHGSAAVMIVNPTTPYMGAANHVQSNNRKNQNRNNFSRSLNQMSNNLGNTNNTNNNIVSSRTGAKAVNLMNNMSETGNFSTNENNQVHRESARALGEAIVAACPDAASVERRLGQIREYIRVTSSLVDTMRNSEEENSVARPLSVQSNGSAYSDNELWQNQIKKKMELSQLRLRLDAVKQEQKILLKYEEEAKHQLKEMNRGRQMPHLRMSIAQENDENVEEASSSVNYNHPNHNYNSNQGTTTNMMVQSSENFITPHNSTPNATHDDVFSSSSMHSHDDQLLHSNHNITNCQEVDKSKYDSDVGNDECLLNERGSKLERKVRNLQQKKEYMENLVKEFQKLQMATGIRSQNTYSSSGEESADDEYLNNDVSNFNHSNIKNKDPFRLLEISAIKTALHKTKDLIKSAENFESDDVPERKSFVDTQHRNDNKSEGGASSGEWSYDSSVCRVRNSLPHKNKITNEQQSRKTPTQKNVHEANIASLQSLVQDMQAETEKIIGARTNIKQMMTTKSKHKKVNTDNNQAGPSSAAVLGPAERRQMELRALLADKQRELDALINKKKDASLERQQKRPSSNNASANHSCNSDQEMDSITEQIILSQENSRKKDSFQAESESSLGSRYANSVPPQLEHAYVSDSESPSVCKSRKNRAQWSQSQEENVNQVNSGRNERNQSPIEGSSFNCTEPTASQSLHDYSLNFPQFPPHPMNCWNKTKHNQDIRPNQFTQNSQSQTMEQLMGAPQLTFPPVPFNMIMPCNMVSGCGCAWGAWCWQQLMMHQRDLQQLREQLNHMEERWRVETASHILNNQVPPGNRANNYWDNFRSYSRQNLLSNTSKTNADGHLSVGPNHSPHPLVERSHNTLYHTLSTPPSGSAKRNTNTDNSTNGSSTSQHNVDLNYRRRKLAYDRSLSFSSAPDVLNVNQHNENDVGTKNQKIPDHENHLSNNNVNNYVTASNAINLSITNPVPEIIQTHSNNLNMPNTNDKKKSSCKLPAKNSKNRYVLETSNKINIANISETSNANLASGSHDNLNKASAKLLDVEKENIYTEANALISVNESNPDFLIKIFKELQSITSEPLRENVLRSIRNVSSTLNTTENTQERINSIIETPNNKSDSSSRQERNSGSEKFDEIIKFLLSKSNEVCSREILEELSFHILVNNRNTKISQAKLMTWLSKYEGMKLSDISSDIIENLSLFSEKSDNSINEAFEPQLQDVAGSLNLFDHNTQSDRCPYDSWPAHMHLNEEAEDSNDNCRSQSSQESKADLTNCSDIHDRDLAEADQICRPDLNESNNEHLNQEIAVADALPDVVDTEETTPTEAEAEWLALDHVPTRLHTQDVSGNQKNDNN